MRPLLPTADSVLPYLERMDSARYYSNNGPLNRAFESRLADRFDVPPAQVVTCSSATLGLEGCFRLLDAESFAVPSYTFPATAMAVKSAGRRLVLTDIDRGSWMVAPSAQEQFATDAIVPVLPFGAALDIDKYRSCRNVVIDAAASVGAIGSLQDLPNDWSVVFSLHATKTLGIGEGGFVVFGNPLSAAHFRAWTNFGFHGSRNSTELGTNAKLSEIAAAYGHAALDQWDAETSDWSQARSHSDSIGHQLGIASIATQYPGVNPYWIAQFGSPDMCSFIESSLSEEGIATRRWWGQGCHQMPAFAPQPGAEHQSFINTEWVAATTLGLPFSRGMKDAEFSRIGSTVGDAQLRWPT
ncbi:MAG: DegT/DnrJ/EryC1/StrS family aminotransferase [Actinobacteria bacterium]|nr:DegT/DnrJ/EryC1/StrS family aminotransferase [Actinomycetota bacterium]